MIAGSLQLIYNAIQVMRVVFMGTPNYSIPVLEALLSLGCQVAGVYTQPDRARGRGLGLEAAPVKSFARERDLPVFQPESLGRFEISDELSSLKPDVVMVAAYGKMLPPQLLKIPPHGCLNIHPSLLPQYRGPSPVASAILQGERNTGVTLMHIDQGADTGPIIAQRQVAIAPDDTTASLTPQLFEVGAQLLIESLSLWVEGKIRDHPQDHSQATFTTKIAKKDGEARWDQPAQELELRIRAFTPWPGLYTHWQGRVLKVLEARALDRDVSGETGLVVALEEASLPVGVITGAGVLGLVSLQVEGRRSMPSKEFMQGHSSFVGSQVPS